MDAKIAVTNFGFYYITKYEKIYSMGCYNFPDYHVSLGPTPQKLQDMGGWMNPLMADYMENYADLLFQLYGENVIISLGFFKRRIHIPIQCEANAV